jgi:hypothetical protein
LLHPCRIFPEDKEREIKQIKKAKADWYTMEDDMYIVQGQQDKERGEEEGI